jgi:molybdopterin molybdotransferase
VAALPFAEARECVIAEILRAAPVPARELVDLRDSAARVLAESVRADRDLPPVPRSLRDGFALRASDLPGEIRVAGEVRAGQTYAGEVRPGEAVEIMTGAPVPSGADAVVMIEHVTRIAYGIRAERVVSPGDFINPRASEARRGDLLLDKGKRLDFADIALLATVGKSAVSVFAKPRVAILPTGDEIVDVDRQPLDHEVRNSNAFSLAAQVERAGGVPVLLPAARDDFDSTRNLIERGLRADLLLLSGGVSAGKYDLVETVLAELGARFFFDRVRIQPGQPLVFGQAGGKFFFGLPGNPASTMVTFEVLARAAVDLLGGVECPSLPFTLARLTTDFRHKPGLTRFLPARLATEAAEITPIPWQGSSDVAALSRANAFLVTDEDREEWKAGELIRVLLK